ncbi:MAG: putative DNA binding domain-containing protein [Thermoflexibacter sp.]
MEATALLKIISGGENSKVQFKENITNAVSIAQEMVAFANSQGGLLIIGVKDKTGEIVGLDFPNIQRINNLLATASNELVKPSIYVFTETVEVQGQHLLICQIQEGIKKPYRDKDGVVWIKTASDKRKVISNEEEARLLQIGGYMQAEEQIFFDSDWKYIDFELFKNFYEKKYDEKIEDVKDLPMIFENLNLAKGNKFNLAGILLFGKTVTRYFPLNQIIGISFFGNEVTGINYRDSENIEGNFRKLFTEGMAFIKRNIKKVQNSKSFNSTGDPEIPLIVFEELLTNALIHRDYFVQNNIRIFIFDNRIEIISPGKLPNSLTVEKIKYGISIKRNPTLASFAFDLINFRGIGSGIRRAIQHYPAIEFINDEIIEEFKVIIYRPLLS